MPATRAEWIELLSPKHDPINNGGYPGPQKARYAKVYGLVREYLTDNWVEDISTQELLEALFPERWTVIDLNDPAVKAARAVLYKSLISSSAKTKLKGCFRQREGDTKNKWGHLPYVWSTPSDPPAAKCCPTCGKAL